jgi:hypothetical protein
MYKKQITMQPIQQILTFSCLWFLMVLNNQISRFYQGFIVVDCPIACSKITACKKAISPQCGFIQKVDFLIVVYEKRGFAPLCQKSIL